MSAALVGHYTSSSCTLDVSSSCVFHLVSGNVDVTTRLAGDEDDVIVTFGESAAVRLCRTKDAYVVKRRLSAANGDQLSTCLAAAAEKSHGLGVLRREIASRDTARRPGAPDVKLPPGDYREQVAIVVVEEQVKLGISSAAK